MSIIESLFRNEVLLAYQISQLPELYPQISKFIVVLEDIQSCDKIADNLRFFNNEILINTYSPWDVLPFDTVSPTLEITSSRLAALYFLQNNNKQIILTTTEALIQKTFSKNYFNSISLSLETGSTINIEDLVSQLEICGYERNTLVEEIGQFAVRGSVIDFFSAHLPMPLRIEFYLDKIKSIRTFEIESQRSLKKIDRIDIIPIKELVIPDLSNLENRERIFAAIKNQVNSQDLPIGIFKNIEECLNNQLYFPGLEFLQNLWFNDFTTIDSYCPNDTTLFLVNEKKFNEDLEGFNQKLISRLEVVKDEGRLISDSKDFYFNAKDLVKLELVRKNKHINEDAKLISLLQLKTDLLKTKNSQNPLKPIALKIQNAIENGYSCCFVISNHLRNKTLSEIIIKYGLELEEAKEGFLSWSRNLKNKKKLYFFLDDLQNGFEDKSKNLLVISERDVFPDTAPVRKKSKSSKIRKFLSSLSQLKENDFIVHIDHGIGIYRGLKQFEVDGKIGDFLFLEYAEGAKLFLPVENISKLQKYAAANTAKEPTLTKLGGKVWNATKSKVKQNVAELAAQLLKIIAKRETSLGLRLEPFNEQDQEFANTFGYNETPDQARAISEVLEDLSLSKPMDRLVCGDVGYGKTEVALRAAFKAVQSGYQVAVMVPTTILADQHYNTFIQRFSFFPVKVSLISRFKSAEENKKSLEELSRGKIDIIIGTHRLIQKDVTFKNLGLLIIDEEHRFGVVHKEKLKRLRTDVHVLTLSATPIPRTLNQSLVGIRDLSLIETPPVNRQVTKTFIAEYSDSIVKEAILRETSRGGQVFYIYNRVDNISLVADGISKMLPELKISFAHGQMKEQELEKIMHQFVSGKIDVLVSTTIVESGLDIANANTIIIRNADRFGLAELYQLRGRVGRSDKKAYAYLLIPDPKTLGADAKKRIDILKTLDDLGIGFRLALQDMEIRGAGNLLGKDQSGHVDLVGYELYSKILKEAIDELKRQDNSQKLEFIDIDPEMKIGFPAHIPQDYVPDISERLILYQRSIELKTIEQAREFFEEIEDRFGTAPEEINILIELMLFRSLLKRYGIVTARYSGGILSFSFHPEFNTNTETLFNCLQQHKDVLKISPSMVFTLRLIEGEVKSPKDLYQELRRVMGSLFFNEKIN